MRFSFLGSLLALSLVLMAGCNEKEAVRDSSSSSAVAAPAASADAAQAAEAAAPPEKNAPPADSAGETAGKSEASKARQAAGEAAGEAAAALAEAADLTLAEAAVSAREGLRDFGEKADKALDKAGSKAGTALKGAAKKADAALEKAAGKADGKLSGLASRASEALGLNEEPAPVPSGPTSGLTEAFLTHQKFVLKKINHADFNNAAGLGAPTLEFGDGFMVSGKICNNYRGPGQLADGRLTVKAMMSTRMACPDTAYGQLENRFFSMLESGAEISMNGPYLTLSQGDSVLTFEADTRR